MVTVRRWYIFLVCAISLQAVTWAVILLLRNFLTRIYEIPPGELAFQAAVLVVGLPMFLGHWLWAERLARRETDERESAVRRLYLYGTLAAFLGPFAYDAFYLLAFVLSLTFDVPYSRAYSEGFSTSETIIRYLVVLAVLGVLWFYHHFVVADDAKTAPERGNAATVRRLYLFGFSAAGGTATLMGVIYLARWALFQFEGGPAISGSTIYLTDEVTRLLVGGPLWLLCWLAAQRLFAGSNEEERASTLRKFYLYFTLFIAVLTTVTQGTIILASYFRQWLALSNETEIRGPLSFIVGMAILWVYHAYVLRDDEATLGAAFRQGVIRRFYLYLVAAVGLGAFLSGLGGDLSLLIRSLSEGLLGDALKDELAWFTAALLAGLAVWVWPWRQTQVEATTAGPVGARERGSSVRKLYLYFYLLVATLTVLSSAVYILYQSLLVALGEREMEYLVRDLSYALAYGLLGVGVWLYHGWAVRGDGQMLKHELAARLAKMRVAVVDGDEGHFGRAVLESLRRELPGLVLHPIGLTPAAAVAMGMVSTPDTSPTLLSQQLAEAELIVGTWAIAGGAAGMVTPEVAAWVAASPARKVLAPVRSEAWEWAGVDRWNANAIVWQTVRAVKQIVAGEEVRAARPLSAGMLVTIVIALIPVLLVAYIWYSFFGSRFF